MEGLGDVVIALLCLAKHSPLRCGFVHMVRRCGHASLSFYEHIVQLGLMCPNNLKISFLWLPMYYVYKNLSVWVIWASLYPVFFRCSQILYG